VSEPLLAPETVAVVGAGRLGAALGRRWVAVGHTVGYGVRDPHDPRHQPLRDHSGAELLAGDDQPAKQHVAALWIRLAHTLGHGPDISLALQRRPAT
jgi:predicted dinucleotide-binding enzyme